MTKDLELPIIKVGQKYKHYKGCIYEVLAFVTHSETTEQMVVYRRADMSEPRLWARPQSMWFDVVMVDNGPVLRFSLYTMDGEI